MSSSRDRDGRSRDGDGRQEAEWGIETEMNALEALMWRSERHPRLSSTTTLIEVLDTAPDPARLRSAAEWATGLVPHFRQRVVEPLLPVGPPVWVADPDFDLDYHLRRAALPSPGTLRELLDLAQALAMTPLQRDRPLWEAVVVEGLDGDRAALILKTHHSWTDGLGAMHMLSLLHSRTREPSPKAPPAPLSRESRSSLVVTARELTSRAGALPDRVGGLASSVGRALLRPRATALEALRFGGSLRRLLAAPAADGSPLFAGRKGKAWRFQAVECSTDELKAAAKSQAASLNHAYVAALLGGVRRYHELFGLDLDELPMAMPMSVRTEDDPSGGNRWTGVFFTGPAGIRDPAERIAAVRGVTLAVSVEPALDLMGITAPILNLAPSGIASLAMANVGGAADLSASNIPGSAEDLYLAGARIERMFGYGPLPGVAIMAALISHAGTCSIALNCDASVVEDTDLLEDCVREELEEVLELGRPAASRDSGARSGRGGRRSGQTSRTASAAGNGGARSAKHKPKSEV